MIDGILLDNIYYAIIYVFIFMGVIFYALLLALTYSSRISLVVNKSTEPSESEDVEPFHVVLVDIERAAYKHEIHCVEKPLFGDEELKFVALSYRWGEVPEQLVDTHLDYVANVKSFHVSDFYRLCRYMKQEPDLKSMKYVWVDAICVDQDNYERRKTTIYQMTNIYQQANYILAVPDLHIRSLIDASARNDEVSKWIPQHSIYIYHLINGNTDTLAELEEIWLDKMNIPQNRILRQMLTSTTNHFVDGLRTYNIHDPDYHSEDAIKHIQYAASHYRKKAPDSGWWFREMPQDGVWEYSSSPSSKETAVFDYSCLASRRQHQIRSASSSFDTQTINSALSGGSSSGQTSEDDEDEDLSATSSLSISTSDEENVIPFVWLHLVLAEVKNDGWKQWMHKRNQHIEASVFFLMELIKDWSIRAWVMSECTIASNKCSRKMKYWFILLCVKKNLRGLPFFEYDFSDTKGYTDLIPESRAHPLTAKMITCARRFRQGMIDILRQKTFVEKMVSSKATKNEDRFSAIFPGVDEYKDLVINKETVHGWQITNFLSVKLKLYELMTLKDKLELLFLSIPERGRAPTLPTFATTTDHDENHYQHLWVDRGHATRQVNFTAIRLIEPTTTTKAFWKLRILPTMYYILKKVQTEWRSIEDISMDKFCDMTRSLWSRLDINVDQDDLVPICIPMEENGLTGKDAYDLISPGSGGAFLQLIGSFEKNKWIVYGLARSNDIDSTVRNQKMVAFEIY